MKKLYVLCTAIALALLSFSLQSQTIDQNTSSECKPGGLPNLYCPYWNVTVDFGLGIPFPTMSISCSTGGEFKCKEKSK